NGRSPARWGSWWRRPSAPARSLLAGVVPEHPRRRELAELVTDHRLRDVHGHVLAAVVHRERVTDHLGRHGAAARPRLDDFAVAGRVHRVDLLAKVLVDERAFLQRTGHDNYLRAPRVRRRRMMSLSLGLPFLRVRPSGLPHGDTGCRPPELLPSPPPS